ncbi:hypothetical protein M6B38_143885 [Iris pallida]|uniref:rRNA N-glycosylase n=1 Tax=Iris pallida TaxID=29817 RepID=A0AAX6FAI9_IRIPA|nr:hypothetical protein M6B38_143885 [Iris pallida]
MKVWLFLAATSVLWTAIVGPAAWVCSSSLSETGDGDNNTLSLDKVAFHVTGSTKKTYSSFLESLRTYLKSVTVVHEIPLLPAQSGSQQNLLLVELFDWDKEPITLVLDRTNAYVIAYQAKNRYYLLADTSDNSQLYGSNPHRLTFTGSYADLQRVAKKNRENINLGINELAQAIYVLYHWNSSEVETSVAHQLIVLIQTVSETSRFGAIEQKFRNNIIDKITPIHYDSFRPGVGVMDLETNWKTLSTAVQQSNAQGVFLKPVTLKVSNTETKEIKDAKTARTFCGLALLLRSTQASLSPHDSSVLFTSLDLNITSMLDIAA